METKNLIRQLKMQRGRYAKLPNAAAEKKVITGICERFGGNEETISALNDNPDLAMYVKKVLGISEEVEAKKVEPTSSEDRTEYIFKDGNVYKLDTIKKTIKKVYNDFSSISLEDLELPKMSLQVYQRYLKDHFNGEDCPIKKGKLIFRNFRISCDSENGFTIEDANNFYEIVETPFDGIPTPKELGEWFKKPIHEHTPEELRKAVERGKELQKIREESKKSLYDSDEVSCPDFEALRRKVLRTIKNIRTKTMDFDPLKFPDMIPFKRWKRNINSVLESWKNRKMRYAKLINEIERITNEEDFKVTEKPKKNSFVGTMLPTFKEVGELVGDKIEVDGKLIDAVPFLLEYLLHYEKRVMPQVMKWAKGEISENDLLKNPMEKDWKVEYDKRALANTSYNARILCLVYDAIGLAAPQSLLYKADLNVGDTIMMFIGGSLKKRVVESISEEGICIGGSLCLCKVDNWVKIEN